MYKRVIPFFCVLLLLLAVGCQEDDTQSQELLSTDFFAMDTHMTLRICGGDESLLQNAVQTVENIESILSVTRDDSEIYQLNRMGSAEISECTRVLLQRAIEICDETGGALDISVYPIVREWGFITDDYHVPDDDVILRLLQNVDCRKIQISDTTAALPEGMEVDLGSVTKGYVGDCLSDMLKEAGVESAILDLGGNVHTIGTKPDGTPWRVAIQSPQGDGVLGVAEIVDEAVITSGGYERYFEDDAGNIWWHIIDPSIGYPARNGVISATVVGDEGLYCDALSTALFVMGEKKAIDYWCTHRDFEMALVTDDGKLLITPGLNERFTPEESGSFDLQVIEYAEN